MSERGPLQKEGIQSRKVGEEWMLYDPEKGSIHIINATAEFVWNMCDGSHTVDDMERNLKDVYRVPEGAALSKDVKTIIHSFAEMGLLVSKEG